MIISVLKHLISLTVGLIIGYFIFAQSVGQTNNNRPSDASTLELMETIEKETEKSLLDAKTQKQSPSENLADDETNAQQELIAKFKQLLAAKNAEIDSLKAELAANKTDKTKAQEEITGLKTMTMEDFESQVKNQFMNRFRGIAIKIEGEQLKGIKREFERNQDKADWNATYENNITDFIQQADPNGLHFVDELTCNKRMCRLSVNSSDATDWQKLYHNMTEESWYRSMTLTEASDNPNRMVYYITQPSLAEER